MEKESISMEKEEYEERCEKLRMRFGVLNESEPSGKVWASCILNSLCEIFMQQPDPQAAYEQFSSVLKRSFERFKEEEKEENGLAR